MDREEERVAKLREVFDLQAKLLNVPTVELALTLYIQILHFKLDNNVSTPCLDAVEMDCLSIASKRIGRTVGELLSGILNHDKCGTYCPLRNVVAKYDKEENRIN